MHQSEIVQDHFQDELEFYVGVWGDPYDQTQGDNHFYNYSMVCTEIASFPSPRLTSEYGWQSFPSFSTLSEISSEKDWAPFSELMIQRVYKL